jgi:hypothetical protein
MPGNSKKHVEVEIHNNFVRGLGGKLVVGHAILVTLIMEVFVITVGMKIQV